jgi:hypothetical protein
VADSTDWVLELDGASAPGEVTLDFAAEGLPEGVHLVLSDPLGGTTEVSPPQQLVVAAVTGPRQLRLAVRHAAPAVLPTATACHAYPNPFHDQVGLLFRLPQAGSVQVAIYDMAGRLVRHLERGLAAQGESVLTWDGLDLAGRPAPVGLYFASYQVGTTRGVTRLVKVR